jgi:hypothetical protein
MFHYHLAIGVDSLRESPETFDFCFSAIPVYKIAFAIISGSKQSDL